MAVMNRTQFAKELQEGLNTVFGVDYKQYPEEWIGITHDKKNTGFRPIGLNFGVPKHTKNLPGIPYSCLPPPASPLT